MGKSRKNKLLISIGVLFIVSGLIFNQWVLTAIFSPDGIIRFNKKVFIIVFDLIVITIGSILIIKREQINIPKKENIILFISVLFVSLVLLEFGTRFYLLNFASKEALLRYGTYHMIQKQNLMYCSHPYLGYYPTPNYNNSNGNKHNSLGYRGDDIILPKPKNKFRIVCIGGSTTYSTSVDDYKDAYPYLLEQELHKMGYDFVEVINAGVGNYDTFHSLINLEFRVLDLNPDMVIVYHGTNDIDGRLVYPYKAYRGDNTGKVSPQKIPSLNLLNRFVITRILLCSTGECENYGSLESFYSASTHLYKQYYNQLIKGVYPSGIFKEHDIYEILENNPPIYTERNYRNMISICKTYNVKIVLASFAYNPFIINNLETAFFTINQFETSTDLFQKAMYENNNLIKKITNETNVPFFNFSDLMPRDNQYWSDGVHLNEKGTRMKATLFAQFIKDEIPTHHPNK